jgi:hypothetical protein
MLKTEVVHFDLVGNRLVPCKPFYCTKVYEWVYEYDSRLRCHVKRYLQLPYGYAEAVQLPNCPQLLIG